MSSVPFSHHIPLHIFSLQVQRFLHDILLDQLSPLVELKLWLAKLAVSNPPVNTRRPLLLEVVPQVISNQNCDDLLSSVHKSKITDFKYCYFKFHTMYSNMYLASHVAGITQHLL